MSNFLDNIDIIDPSGEITNVLFQDRGALALINTIIANSCYANVKDYGAIGDGITDDRTAIINAINSNKPVFFPTGVYRVSTQIDVTDGIFIIGAGVGKSIIKFDTQEIQQKYIFNNTDDNTHKKGAIFKDITLDVNNYNQNVSFIGGILLTNYESILIDNIEVLNTSNGGNGITLWHCSVGTVSNCYCHNLYGDGIYVCNGSSDIHIVSNKIVDCDIASGCIDIYDSERIIAKGNYVCPNELTRTFGFNLDTVREAIITNNHCINGHRGIACFVINESVICNNTCRNNSYAGIHLEISIDGVTASYQNLISNNVLLYNGFGIIDNCNGYYNKYADNIVSFSNKHGIYIIGSNYTAIDGNVVTNNGLETANTYCDIVINGETNTNIYSSIINNTCNSPNAFVNISTTTGASGLLITGNNCIAKGSGLYNIQNVDMTARIIANNRGTYNE